MNFSQSNRKRSAAGEEDREMRQKLLNAYDTDSSSSNDMDPKAKKVKADDLEDRGDHEDDNDDEEPSFHEEMLVREIEGLLIEKRKTHQEMERLNRQYQAARDELKRKKKDIDSRIAMKRSRMKPRKSQPDTHKTELSGESSRSSDNTSSDTTDDLADDQQDRKETATAPKNEN